MSTDEDPHRDKRQQRFVVVSNDASFGRNKTRKNGRDVSQAAAIAIVDRLEQALRNVFK